MEGEGAGVRSVWSRGVAASALALAGLAAGCAAERAFDDAPYVDVSGLALPAGAGRAELVRACTTCHDLGGLEAYKGYYDDAKWRDMVLTMVDHGAELDADGIDAVVGYLVACFGPDET